MSGFWSEAFDSLGDNLTLLGKAGEDVVQNLNPFSDEFATGEARATAAEVERQLAQRGGREFDQSRADQSAKDGLAKIVTGAKDTAKGAGKTIGTAADGASKVAGSALDALTSPVVLGIAGVVVVLVLLAPYLSPVVAKALK